MSKRYEVSEDDDTADLGDVQFEDAENNVFETIDNDENKLGEQVVNANADEDVIQPLDKAGE